MGRGKTGQEDEHDESGKKSVQSGNNNEFSGRDKVCLRANPHSCDCFPPIASGSTMCSNSPIHSETVGIPNSSTSSETGTDYGTTGSGSEDRARPSGDLSQDNVIPKSLPGIQLTGLIFHPLIVPAYVMIILIFGQTVMRVLPSSVLLYIAYSIVFNVLLLPLLALLLLRLFGFIRSFRFLERRERLGIMLITLICYIFCLYGMDDIFTAVIIRKVLIAFISVLVATTAISVFGLPSVHMSAAGAAISILLWAQLAGAGNVTPYIIGAILITGIVSSIRIYGGRETLLRSFTGFVTGLTTAALIMFLV